MTVKKLPSVEEIEELKAGIEKFEIKTNLDGVLKKHLDQLLKSLRIRHNYWK